MTNNLELYKVFYYAAKTGSITGAAAELSITQPAVSQSMKQLESLLGVKLFTRTAKGIRLTHEGDALFPYVAKGYESISQGERKVKELLDLDLGEIRIGASDMTLKYYLLPYLEKFHVQYPKIKVTVYNSPTPETLSAMAEGKIDFGIVSSPLPGKLELTIKKVREIHDIFVAGSRFLHLKDRQLPYQILEHLPVICLEKNTSTRRYIDSFLKENGVSLSRIRACHKRHDRPIRASQSRHRLRHGRFCKGRPHKRHVVQTDLFRGNPRKKFLCCQPQK